MSPIASVCTADAIILSSREVTRKVRLAAMIDDEKLSEFNALFGYYQIVTSELEMPDHEVIDKYHGLTQIKDQFREMKSTLETRPVYVRTSEHIEAHLMVCFIALTMMRLVQRKTKAVLAPECGKGLNWTYGLPGARLTKALREWQVNELPGDYYQMLNASDGDIVTLFVAKSRNPSGKDGVYHRASPLRFRFLVCVYNLILLIPQCYRCTSTQCLWVFRLLFNETSH